MTNILKRTVSFLFIFICCSTNPVNEVTTSFNGSYKWHSEEATDYIWTYTGYSQMTPAVTIYDTTRLGGSYLAPFYFFIIDSFSIADNKFYMKNHQFADMGDLNETMHDEDALLIGTFCNTYFSIDSTRNWCIIGSPSSVKNKGEQIRCNFQNGGKSISFYRTKLSAVVYSSWEWEYSIMYSPGDISLDSLKAIVLDKVKRNGYEDTTIYNHYTIGTTHYTISIELEGRQ